MSGIIYLDCSATTPLDPRVFREMEPFFINHFGNASSTNHAYGKKANTAFELALDRVAELLFVNPGELIFTSGATESVNLAIKGVFERYAARGKHFISAKTEHRAVLDCLEWVEKKGGQVSWLAVDKKGGIDLDELQATIKKETVMVCLMWGNNETGHIHPIEKIGEICREKGVLFFSDATQSTGKIETHPKSSHVDLMAFSAHKFYGPKGVGGLYVSGKNPRVKLRPQIQGGGQQDNRRAGTLNIPGIVGLGAAASLAKSEMVSDSRKSRELILSLHNYLLQELQPMCVNGGTEHKLPHILNLSFKNIRSKDFLNEVEGSLALSSGSACSTRNYRVSHVLRAMQLIDWKVQSALRFSIGKFTDREDVLKAGEITVDTVNQLRKLGFPHV